MFDRLLDFVARCWEHLVPCEIVKVYEGGAVLRFGCLNRTVGPGLAWKYPVIEDIITVNTVLTTLRLPPQTLTTADGNSVVMAAIIKYRVEDVAAYVTQIWDATDVLADVSMGTVRERVQKASWADCLNGDLSNEVTIAVRRAVKRFGFAVESITFTDFGRVRSLRLIQQPITNLEN